MANYTNLVFEGGGVKGIAYAGALKVLETAGILPHITAVAGTSAGAITAAMVALGYSADQVHEVIGALDFSSFEDHEGPIRIFDNYGIHPGEAFLDWMQKQVAGSPLHPGLSPNATFAELSASGGRDLHVFATDLYTQSLREFSNAKTPNVVVAEAVRASMSIPLFFNAWQFSNNIPDDHIYVDGGVIYNYPITTFDTNGVNPQTLGFRLENTEGKPTFNDFGFHHWVSYVKYTFETLLSAQNINTHRDPDNLKRSVIINDLGIGATNFNLTKDQQQALFDQGVAATNAFLGVTA